MPEERNRNEGRERGRESGGSGGTAEHSLKEREYRGRDGEIHHHTNTYMEQHKGERKSGDSRNEAGGRDR